MRLLLNFPLPDTVLISCHGLAWFRRLGVIFKAFVFLGAIYNTDVLAAEGGVQSSESVLTTDQSSFCSIQKHLWFPLALSCPTSSTAAFLTFTLLLSHTLGDFRWHQATTHEQLYLFRNQLYACVCMCVGEGPCCFKRCHSSGALSAAN